jgi:hypothetical protein
LGESLCGGGFTPVHLIFAGGINVAIGEIYRYPDARCGCNDRGCSAFRSNRYVGLENLSE